MPSRPSHSVDELFDGLSRKNFLGHLKKNIVQRNVAEKKILASNWGMKKNSCTEKLPNPPPPQISNDPSLRKEACELAFRKKAEVKLEFESYVTKRHQSIVLNTESENLEFSPT
jgi:hypothetical protein